MSFDNRFFRHIIFDDYEKDAMELILVKPFIDGSVENSDMIFISPYVRSSGDVNINTHPSITAIFDIDSVMESNDFEFHTLYSIRAINAFAQGTFSKGFRKGRTEPRLIVTKRVEVGWNTVIPVVMYAINFLFNDDDNNREIRRFKYEEIVPEYLRKKGV